VWCGCNLLINNAASHPAVPPPTTTIFIETPLVNYISILLTGHFNTGKYLTMSITYIFKSFMTTEMLSSINNSELIKYAHSLKSESTGVVKSNVNGWQSDILTKPNLEIKKLVDIVNLQLHDLRGEYGIKDDFNFQINNLWININTKLSFNRPHIHPESAVSGVYYVSVPKNSGNIVFNHPSRTQQYHIRDEAVKVSNDINSSTWHVTPDAGLLIAFPSWLEHYVEPNNNEDERISIAFNAHIEKNYEKK
jgi:uncharacterized protein (TIGR02466 family)